MPATLVWKLPNRGALDQVQVGAADIVATISAANSAWGWIGGLDGIRNVVSNFPRLLGQSNNTKSLCLKLKLQPSVCRIFTSSGIALLVDEQTDNAFSGHPVTQLIGQTICALAYVQGISRAVKLFVDHIAPFLLAGAEEGMNEALHAQLSDKAQIILNEGQSRGLPLRFKCVIERLNLPVSAETLPNEDFLFDSCDYTFVIGLLRWIRTGRQETYLTRSALTAQVAACLQEVGFSIGPIAVWDGKNSPPATWNGVTLVIGGSVLTDQLMPNEEPDGLLATLPVTHHYHYDSIGSLLFNAMRSKDAGIAPEALANYFFRVETYLRRSLRFTWEWNPNLNKMSTQAVAHWEVTPQLPRLESISLSLASLHFGSSGGMLAYCYESIATEETLSAVRAYDPQSIAPLVAEVARFKAITLSILISIAGIIAGNDFEKLDHALALDIRRGELEEVSAFLDKGLTTGMLYWKVVMFIAIFHCAAGTSLLKSEDFEERSIVGYRDGAKGVFPSMLFNLAPTPKALGVQCVDEFYCVPVGSDHTVRDLDGMETWTPDVWAGDIAGDAPVDTDGVSDDTTFSIAVPRPAPPDAKIHVSFERVASSSDPYLCLAARHNGHMIGAASIRDIMKTLVLSLQVPTSCPREGHTNKTRAKILQASQWAANRWRKPTDQYQVTNYVAVANDDLWAMLLAGQVALAKRGGFLVYECFDCAVDMARKLDFGGAWTKTEAGGVFVGYCSARDTRRPL